MAVMVCLYCGTEPAPGSHPLGTLCRSCHKPLLLTEKK